MAWSVRRKLKFRTSGGQTKFIEIKGNRNFTRWETIVQHILYKFKKQNRQFKKTFQYFSKKCVREGTCYIQPCSIFACGTKYCSFDESTKTIPNFNEMCAKASHNIITCCSNEYKFQLIFVYWNKSFKIFLIFQHNNRNFPEIYTH